MHYNTKEFLINLKERLENLKNILLYCKDNNLLILMDEMYWLAFDNRNIIHIIDQLHEVSLNNQVVVTTTFDNVKELLKRRTYKPNIIDLNNFMNNKSNAK